MRKHLSVTAAAAAKRRLHTCKGPLTADHIACFEAVEWRYLSIVMSCPAATRAAPSSPKPNSASQNKQKKIDSPATAGPLSPDVSISSAETHSQKQSQGDRPPAKAPAGKHKSSAETAKAKRQAEGAVLGKAKPKRGQTSKARQDKAAQALPAGTTHSSHDTRAEAADDTASEAAMATEPTAKRKKPLYAVKHALPLASSNASTAALHGAPENSQTDAAASQAQSGQGQKDTGHRGQPPQEFTCARARPWKESRKLPAVDLDISPAGVEQAQAEPKQPASQSAQHRQAADQGAHVLAPVAEAAAADATRVAESKGHVGSTGRPHDMQHDSSAQPAAGRHQASLMHQSQPKQMTDAQQSPTSRHSEGHEPHERLSDDPHGQTRADPHGRLGSDHMGAAHNPTINAGHTGESSVAGNVSMKSNTHAAPAEAGQRSKSSHRGGYALNTKLFTNRVSRASNAGRLCIDTAS